MSAEFGGHIFYNMKPPKTPTPQTWEERFDIFMSPRRIRLIKVVGIESYIVYIKEFIDKEIQRTREELIERVIKDINEFELQSGFGSASGGVMQKAVIDYLSALSKE